MKRLLTIALRLGVLAVVIALVIKLLDDRQAETPQPSVEPPRPPEPRAPQPSEPVAAEQPAPTVSWVEPQGTVCPTSHPIKAKLSSKVFRKPESSGYASSKPDRCYASEDAAQADGFREAKR